MESFFANTLAKVKHILSHTFIKVYSNCFPEQKEKCLYLMGQFFLCSMFHKRSSGKLICEQNWRANFNSLDPCLIARHQMSSSKEESRKGQYLSQYLINITCDKTEKITFLLGSNGHNCIHPSLPINLIFPIYFIGSYKTPIMSQNLLYFP